MGRKRKNTSEEIGTENPQGNGLVNQGYDSDESLHLPDVVFGSTGADLSGKVKRKKKSKKEKDDYELFTSNRATNDENAPHIAAEKNVSSTNGVDSRFGVYLIQKPIELLVDELNGSPLHVGKCSFRSERVLIGGKFFKVRESPPSTQMFHIPAEIICSSEKSFKGMNSLICGVVRITRMEFEEPTNGLRKGSETADQWLRDMPLKVIRKKVSKKCFRNLRQRLWANGGKRDGNGSPQAA